VRPARRGRSLRVLAGLRWAPSSETPVTIDVAAPVQVTAIRTIIIVMTAVGAPALGAILQRRDRAG